MYNNGQFEIIEERDEEHDMTPKTVIQGSGSKKPPINYKPSLRTPSFEKITEGIDIEGEKPLDMTDEPSET